MDTNLALNYAIRPAIQLLNLASKEAEVMLLAIGLQESRFKHRVQVQGPARGYWQFEKGGGVAGVLNHRRSKTRAFDLCTALDVAANSDTVYLALAHQDILAAGFARLLLFTDPKPLPAVGDVNGAWDYYYRNWRPGKPHLATWAGLYAEAVKACA